MSQGTECTPEFHVWRRRMHELSTPIPADRFCACCKVKYSTLPAGVAFLAEYQDDDGSIRYSGRDAKK
jgi:hypothetical protein